MSNVTINFKNLSFMKTNSSFLILLILAIACGSEEENSSMACSFSFDGINYVHDFATCGFSGATEILTSTNGAGTQLITIAKGGGIDDAIIFSPSVGSVPVYHSSSPPTITISGKKWTFSGAMENVDTGAAAGDISGNCTCQN
jgi:hypothetical protein